MKKHVVAVYGSLKRGFGNFRTMRVAEGEFIAEAISVDNFVMDGGMYPYINQDKNGYPIAVELFEVGEGGLGGLDNLEGHPTFYKREIKTFITSEGKKVKAWVYILQGKVKDNPTLLQDGVYVWEETWK